MPKALFKKHHGVSRRVNTSQPSGNRFTKPFPPKTLNMAELAKDRERSRKLYIDQVLSMYASNTCFVDLETFPALNPSEKHTFADLHGLNTHWMMTTCPRKTLMERTQTRACCIRDCMEMMCLLRRFVRSYACCMYASSPQIFVVSHISFPYSMRHQRDERTWTSRVTDLHQNWKPLVEGITDAYLQWRYGDSTHAPTEDTTISPPCFDDNAIPPELMDVEITVINVYTLSRTVKLSRTDDQTTAVALAGLGFIGNTPFKPSVVVSMKTLELYRLLHCRKASFSVESFIKVICDLYKMSSP